MSEYELLENMIEVLKFVKKYHQNIKIGIDSIFISNNVSKIELRSFISRINSLSNIKLIGQNIDFREGVLFRLPKKMSSSSNPNPIKLINDLHNNIVNAEPLSL